MSHLNTTKTASVSDDVYWKPIDESTPRGVKLQLISDKYGVAQYGTLQTGQVFFTHWQDLPQFIRLDNQHIDKYLYENHHRA